MLLTALLLQLEMKPLPRRRDNANLPRERPCFRFGGALITGEAAGDSGFKHRQQHHTLQQLRCAFFSLFLFCCVSFIEFYCFCGNSPHAKEEIFAKLGVPVCYSAQLMGNPGYIFF